MSKLDGLIWDTTPNFNFKKQIIALSLEVRLEIYEGALRDYIKFSMYSEVSNGLCEHLNINLGRYINYLYYNLDQRNIFPEFEKRKSLLSERYSVLFWWNRRDHESRLNALKDMIEEVKQQIKDGSK